MPLEPAGVFLYALMVVTLYTSPISIGLLIYAWRQGQFKRALLGIIVTIPVLSLLGIGVFNLSMLRESARYEADRETINNLLATDNSIRRFYGDLIETYELGGFEYGRYRFRFGDQYLELTRPIDKVTSVATLDFTSEYVGQGDYELWILPDKIHNPVNLSRDDFFTHKLNQAPPRGDVVFLRLYSGSNSHVFYWAEDRWLSQRVVMEFL